MNVALIDVDGLNRKKSGFPNLPLMKLSAHHKRRGDTVDHWNGLQEYDVAYKSKVFDFSPEPPVVVRASQIIEGGTGYGLNNALPHEIEHMAPDYSLYPNFKAALGFLTRGCPRNCPFCIVGPKEGLQAHKVADLSEFWQGQREIKLLDPNLLACEQHEDLLRQLIDSRAAVDFTQGLDIRLTTKRNTDLIKQVKVERIHFAWDNPREDLTGAFAVFKKQSAIADYRKLGVYVLTNFNSTHEEDLYRVYTLRDLGFWPYIMIYNKQSAPRETRLLQRWVNNRTIFSTVPTFAQYDARIG